jgi:hypothetical protein
MLIKQPLEQNPRSVNDTFASQASIILWSESLKPSPPKLDWIEYLHDKNFNCQVKKK